MDDGGGCVMTLAAARRLLADGRRPARTVRVVFFTCEEFGGYGGQAYLEAHRHELDRHVAALESDGGAFAPAGFSVQGDSLAVAAVAGAAPSPWRPWARPTCTPAARAWTWAPSARRACRASATRWTHEHYFDYHHSPADTFDKIDPDDLGRNVAAIAGLRARPVRGPGAPERPRGDGPWRRGATEQPLIP